MVVLEMGYFIINKDNESQIGSKIKLFFSSLLIATFKLAWYVINVENIKASHQQPWWIMGEQFTLWRGHFLTIILDMTTEWSHNTSYWAKVVTYDGFTLRRPKSASFNYWKTYLVFHIQINVKNLPKYKIPH